MVAIGVSPMGCTQPVCIPAGTDINGQKYKVMIAQSYFPQMSAIAQLYGKGRLWSFQQDNAPARKTRDALDSIKKNPLNFLHIGPLVRRVFLYWVISLWANSMNFR